MYFSINELHDTPEKVKDWCDDDLICLDQKDPDDINVDKLKKQLSKKQLSKKQLSKKDRDRW